MNTDRGITKRNVVAKAGHSVSKTNTRSGKRIRTRVKSRPRFITFLVIVIGLFVGGFGFATGINDTTASVTTDYTSYTVAPGDTVWDIAKHFKNDDTDIGKAVYEICHANDIQDGCIQSGMILTIPENL